MKKIRYIQHPPTTHPSVGYSHAVAGTGDLVVVSGQVPLDEHGDVVGVGDTGRQAGQVFVNLINALSAAGAAPSDIVKLTYFLTSMADLPLVLAARDRHVDPTRPPASTVIEVRALYHPEVRVEIEALALVDH
jgi:enamine deaminase RidA (YjgF/YER057c/UK114 family)